MEPFEAIYQRACDRHGGASALGKLMPEVRSAKALARSVHLVRAGGDIIDIAPGQRADVEMERQAIGLRYKPVLMLIDETDTQDK